MLGTPALFATAYGNLGSSIYYALGPVAGSRSGQPGEAADPVIVCARISKRPPEGEVALVERPYLVALDRERADPMIAGDAVHLVGLSDRHVAHGSRERIIIVVTPLHELLLDKHHRLVRLPRGAVEDDEPR